MISLTRRAVVAGIAAAPLAARAAGPREAGRDDFRLAALERVSGGGRLGVVIVDTGNGGHTAYRANERFPMCSTFKLLAAGYALRRVDQRLESLDRQIAIPATGLLSNSPTTQQHGGAMMTVAALCEAAMTVSDNTAANLLLASFGGPAGLTGFVGTLEDHVTRLDRTEPDLNEGRIGDVRDTTTPEAMARTLRRLALGGALSPTSRALLVRWLVGNKTGDTRLRAGLPAGWVVGDKTGTADDNGTSNDIAVIWPPDRAPMIVTVYLTQSKLDGGARNALIAEVGKIAAAV